MLMLIYFMTQQSDRRETQTLHNPTRNEAARRSLKDMIELIQQKKQYYKKAISQIQPDLAQGSLRYLFNCNNTIEGITPQQRQFIEEENIARGNIPQKEEEQKVQSRRRLRLNKNKYKNMKKKSPHIDGVPSFQRYKTEPNESKSKELKRSILCSPFNPLPNIAKQQLSHSKLRIAIAEMRRSGKNTEKVERLYSTLSSFNPFMMKIGKIIGVCLLRIGHIEEFLNDSILYETNTECNRFYIILQGEAKLRGKEGLKKTYQTGESLLQQIIFMEEKFPLEKAKVSKRTILLEIEKFDFSKLMQELYKFGYKQGAQQLSSLLRRNFIAKNWLREKSRQAYNS